MKYVAIWLVDKVNMYTILIIYIPRKIKNFIHKILYHKNHPVLNVIKLGATTCSTTCLQNFVPWVFQWGEFQTKIQSSIHRQQIYNQRLYCMNISCTMNGKILPFFC